MALILPLDHVGLYQMTPDHAAGCVPRCSRCCGGLHPASRRARGLKTKAINFRHALKNTLVPVITVTGLQLGRSIALRSSPNGVSGAGPSAFFSCNAIQFVDIPVMAAYLMLISVMFVGINLLVDLLYVAIDPRLRS